MDSHVALVVVVRSYRGDSWIESRRHTGDFSAAGNRAQQDDPILIDLRTLIQEVHRADHVPCRPSRITLAHQEELLAEVVPRAVCLAIPRSGLGPLAIAGALDDQYCGSRPRPDLSHIVQFALYLRVVLASHNDDCREP